MNNKHHLYCCCFCYNNSCYTAEMEEKSDVYRIEKLQGTYSFQIEGFSGVFNRVGDLIMSPEFTLCGNTWQLRIYPGGNLEANKGFVSVYIANNSNKVVKAKYKIVLTGRGSDGQDTSLASSSTEIFEAKGNKDLWGFVKFIEIIKLQNPSNGFCIDDIVIFKVDLTVYGEPLHVRVPSIATVVPNSLGDTLSRMSTEGTATDVTFSITAGCEEQPLLLLLHAHKCILMARSEVFRAMFSSNMSEASTGLIHISDLPHSVVSEMLHYMYTDTFTSHTALVTHSEGLLVAAFKYRVVGLMTTCEYYFSSVLTDDNVANTLRLADTHNAVNLRQWCIDYIVRNACYHILLSKEWRDLDDDLREAVTKELERCRSSRKRSASSGAK